MKEIRTEINIEASAHRVWEILTRFSDYPSWNPFIQEIKGELTEGSRLEVKLQPADSRAMVFKPVCLSVKKNREFIWLGHLLTPGMFDGKHVFELSETGRGKTKFVQREEFTGILVALFWKNLDKNTRKGFETMNQKLKERAEKK